MAAGAIAMLPDHSGDKKEIGVGGESGCCGGMVGVGGGGGGEKGGGRRGISWRKGEDRYTGEAEGGGSVMENECCGKGVVEGVSWRGCRGRGVVEGCCGGGWKRGKGNRGKRIGWRVAPSTTPHRHRSQPASS